MAKKPYRNTKFINLDLWYEISVNDIKTGKLLRHKKARCYSFVYNFMALLNINFAGGGRFADFTSTAGTSRTGSNGMYASSGWAGNIEVTTGDDTFGLQVGTGNTAATITDFALATKILHGTSAGRLQYSSSTFGAPATSGADTTFIATRVFTNGSAGSITVKEIGIVFTQVLSVNADKILMARDVISDTAVGVGQALTLNYTFKTTA